MSIDAYLVVDTGGEHPAYVTDGHNYTHNVSGMWTEAMRRTGLCPQFDSFYDMLRGGDDWADGKPTGIVLSPPTAAQLVPVLRAMIVRMEADPASFRAMNPSNGWGDYDGALEFLRLYLADCLAHPAATVRVSI